MRRIAPAVALVLVAFFVLSPSAVMTQPFGLVGPRQPAVLNGCSENAIFAVMQTQAGRECLKALPRYANVSTEFSLFCKAGRWGCCLKTAGFGACKILEAIPAQAQRRPPAALPD